MRNSRGEGTTKSVFFVQRAVASHYGDKTYYKSSVNLPDAELTVLGWGKGTPLSILREGDSLVLRKIVG
jgi:hypothetical protein